MNIVFLLDDGIVATYFYKEYVYMSSDLTGGYSGESLPAAFTVSDVSRRLQAVGQVSLDALHQVDERTFSTQEARFQMLGERLLAARDAGEPLVEIEAVERGNEIGDGLYDILGLSADTPIIMNITHSTGLEGVDYRNRKEMRLDTVGLSIPGGHVISLDGTYGRHVSSVLASGSYSGYEVEGQINEFGNPIRANFSAGYTYENDGKRAIDRMHDVLDSVEAALGRTTNITRLPSGLDIIEVVQEAHQGFPDSGSPKDFADLVFEALNGREEATISIPCEDFTLPSAIIFGAGTEIEGQHYPFYALFGGALEHYYGIRPTSWSAAETPGSTPMQPFSESIVLKFGDTPEYDGEDLESGQPPIDTPSVVLPTSERIADDNDWSIKPEKVEGAEEITDSLYYRGGTGNEVLIDPATLNLDELPLVLAMAGWTTITGFPDGDTVNLSLTDCGGSGGKSGMEIAMELQIIDSETGALLPGFAINEASGNVCISYNGVPNMRFAEFVKALHGLSPFRF